ncbi:MAG TPA: nitroreductase family protein, partial [Nitrospiraceae bacterium]|nr:nitroreductase family protein [Nitrospiraceae bacterium]
MSRDLPFAQPTERPVSNDPAERVIWYHNRTKHHFNRYARSLGFLDWANQPDPFRRFAGTELVALPLLKPDDGPASPAYDAIYEKEAVPSQPVTVRTLSRFLEFALALSAWKRAGESEWALRTNPSSGNLHPTEGYLILPELEGLQLRAGLYHYAPKEHGLEFRAAYAAGLLAKLLTPFPADAFLFGLTSVHWREAWKYGERAFRYCNHDVGHAIGTARIAAATLGWDMALLDGTEQNTIARLLGTHRTADYADVEPEHPDCLAVLWPAHSHNRLVSGVDRPEPTQMPLYVAPDLAKSLSEEGPWYGKANSLSRDHAVHWDIIDEAAEASWKTTAEHHSVPLCPAAAVPTGVRPVSRTASDAGDIIRRRRSAVAFDGHTSISADTLFRMLDRVMPRAMLPQVARPMPWDVWPYEPAVHLMLFVHRVEGLKPGLYFLLRDQRRFTFVREAMNPELEWTPAPGCPERLPLYWLLEGDAKRLAAQVSCHQDIAGDSAFSLGMLAEFEGRLRGAGAWCYPRLFWETGLIGQVLYLEAEAAGVRATGIGCFFDDAVHEIVAIKDLSL